MKNGPYTLIIAPEQYPGKRYRKRYCYEHHYIWWKYTGNIVPKEYVIHHKNEVKTDNRIENLQLLYYLEHIKEHSVEKSEKSKVSLICDGCSRYFKLQGSRYKVRINQKNNKNIYCNRSCYKKYCNINHRSKSSELA